MYNFDELDNKEKRRLIEAEILGKTRNGNFDKTHKEMYEVFFSIFKSLSEEYEKNKKIKKIKVIDFIEQKNMLKEYYEIVKGNASQVRKNHYNRLKEESEKRTNEIQKQIWEKKCQEEKLEKDRLLEKIKNGQITEADNLNLMIHGLSDYCIGIKVNDDKL